MTDPYSGSCCNFLPEKCGRNEGDCDSDADCKAGLSCGIDNCPAWGNFHPEADCCSDVVGIHPSSVAVNGCVSVSSLGSVGRQLGQRVYPRRSLV